MAQHQRLQVTENMGLMIKEKVWQNGIIKQKKDRVVKYINLYKK